MSERRRFADAERDRAGAEWSDGAFLRSHEDRLARSRARPLRWTGMLLSAATLGALIGAIGAAVVRGTGGEDALFHIMFWTLLGGVAGLIAMSILERIGVFRRTDE